MTGTRVRRVTTADVARGTRPANRRELIVAAARDLFEARGYDHVGMGDIADAVAIGPSALYRHFSGKQDLLYEVLTSSIAPVRAQLESLGPTEWDDWLSGFVKISVQNSQSGALWQREARHLSEAQYRQARDEIREIGALLARQIGLVRPELQLAAADFLAWSVFAVLLSPSFHQTAARKGATPEVLFELAQTVVDSPSPVARPRSSAARGALSPQLRREALLANAIKLFAERGYTNVGLEDIGATLGIAGPSVYNHFPTKIEMLETALDRGWSYLLVDLNDALASSADATGALRMLLGAYVRFAAAHPAIVGILITESRHLPEESQAAFRQAQRDYIDEWVALVLAAHPELSDARARTTVHAMMGVVNDAVRMPELREVLDVRASLELVCGRLLGLDHD